MGEESLGGPGGDLVPTTPRCVCPKVKDMAPFSVSKEGNELRIFHLKMRTKSTLSLHTGENYC